MSISQLIFNLYLNEQETDVLYLFVNAVVKNIPFQIQFMLY